MKNDRVVLDWMFQAVLIRVLNTRDIGRIFRGGGGGGWG